MQELKTISNLVQSLKCVPGIGNKSAERIAYEFLKMDSSKISALISSLEDIKNNISICPKCGCYKESGTCLICEDETRDNSLLIVVTSFKDVLAFERLTSIHALYHVLNGSISPTKGITASDINISNLIKRIKEGTFKEVLLATNPTIDGETTALYIKRLLEEFSDLKITRLAYGLPMGANLDYTDELTLTRELEGRTDFKK